MPESIFDPNSTQTERSGSTFLGPQAQDDSQMPPDLIDGVVTEEEAAELDEMAACQECPGLPGLIAPFPTDLTEETQNIEPPGTL
jgi:hypothetical protein